MPPAARITDDHTCPKMDPPAHKGGEIQTGAQNVKIGYQNAARVGDKALCTGTGALDPIAKGEPTVKIAGQDAARLGDPTEHGGKVVAGCPTVLIGSDTYRACLKSAAASGSPTVSGLP
ncbi:MAG TPA: PAAR domain-containing protein [Polyangiaceae bacterium]|jgi:uncharacterized Zn-binding protein involved in type VI secretion|nr:PAAR domain-containing protein [Polyangiaceae bacterium]